MDNHQFLSKFGDVAAWGLLAAATMGWITKLAVVVGIIWHLCQIYSFFHKKVNAKKQYKRRASDRQ